MQATVGAETCTDSAPFVNIDSPFDQQPDVLIPSFFNAHIHTTYSLLTISMPVYRVPQLPFHFPSLKDYPCHPQGCRTGQLGSYVVYYLLCLVLPLGAIRLGERSRGESSPVNVPRRLPWAHLGS